GRHSLADQPRRVTTLRLQARLARLERVLRVGGRERLAVPQLLQADVALLLEEDERAEALLDVELVHVVVSDARRPALMQRDRDELRHEDRDAADGVEVDA